MAQRPTTAVTSEIESADSKQDQKSQDISCDIFSFYCLGDNESIPSKWVCDGFNDCTDGYDEQPKFCSK